MSSEYDFGIYRPVITLAQIRAAKPKAIYYGARTCWWTHDPAHLHSRPAPTPPGGSPPDIAGLPCDPAGGVLFETDNVDGFLSSAEENPTRYGKHGILAFIAAHNSNCRMSTKDARPVAYSTWDAYNLMIDVYKKGPRA